MKDSTNRRLLIIFGLCLLLSIGAITIGFMGMVDLLDSGIVNSVRQWIEPIIALRSDGPTFSGEDLPQQGPLALDVEATQMVEKQQTIKAIYADWPIIVTETFINNDMGWPVFDQEDDLANLAVEIESGKYRWTAQANEGFVWWSYPDLDPLSDFYAELEVDQTQGDLYGEVGLVFRLTDDLYYLFEVSGGEFFSLWRSDPDGWSELFDWTTSAAIKPSGMNKLGVLALEERIYLFINETLVGEFSDGLLASGVIGVAIGLDEPGDEAQFEFDNLIIKAP